MQRELIESQLRYRFSQAEWLSQALTHPSASGQRKELQLAYERLEYLGDAVLELAVSTALFHRFPEADEGTLTKMRAAVVSRKHLAGLAEQLGWGQQLTMSAPLERSGGRHTLSVLANTFESVIGAVMMDGGYEPACRVSMLLLEESLKQTVEMLSANPKGELQELLQSLSTEGPTYDTRQEEGMPPAFTSTVRWRGQDIGRGAGSSKRKAEMAAAADALCRKESLRHLPAAAEKRPQE